MLKKMTLLTAATIALYGCGGGGSSSGSTSESKGPQSSFDYPIQNSSFKPEASTKLHYVTSADGQQGEPITISFEPMAVQKLIDRLRDTQQDDPFIPVIQLLENNGITQFYLDSSEQEGNTIYFAGIDGALHEVTDLYLIDSLSNVMMMNSSPLFRLEGSTVKEKDPNIDISKHLVSVIVDLSGEQVKRMLDSFDDNPWVNALADNAQCKTTWSQQVGETGARKTFNVSGKSVEAAYLTEKNTYNLVCDGMELNDSKEFESSAERWFNPTLGFIEQVELLKSEQIQVRETKVTLNKIEKA
ncbi:hypothetical protein ACUCAK_005298 [Vibrio harveyi]